MHAGCAICIADAHARCRSCRQSIMPIWLLSEDEQWCMTPRLTLHRPGPWDSFSLFSMLKLTTDWLAPCTMCEGQRMTHPRQTTCVVSDSLKYLHLLASHQLQAFPLRFRAKVVHGQQVQGFLPNTPPVGARFEACRLLVITPAIGPPP